MAKTKSGVAVVRKLKKFGALIKKHRGKIIKGGVSALSLALGAYGAHQAATKGIPAIKEEMGNAVIHHVVNTHENVKEQQAEREAHRQRNRK